MLTNHASSIIVDLNYSYLIIKIYVQPLLLTPAYFLTVAALVAFLFFEIPKLSFLVVGFISISYFLIYLVVQKTLSKFSDHQSNAYDNLQKLLFESLSNIVETFSFKLWPYFINKYSTFDSSYIEAQNTVELFSTFPRFLLESLIFLLLGISFLLISISEYDSRSFLVFLALFAISIQKIIPNINQLYTFYSFSLGYSYAVTGFLDLLAQPKFSSLTRSHTYQISKQIDTCYQNNDFKPGSILPKQIINLNDFTIYFDSGRLFAPISFNLAKGEWLSLTGPSGSGKSSILNAVLGFVPSYNGTISLFSRPLPPHLGIINSSFVSLMGDLISYVPQKSILYSDSLGFNLTLKSSPSSWDLDTISNLFNICCVDFINSDSPKALLEALLLSYSSLSGGQLQRLSLVHSLYNKPVILVANEFTSLLDRDLEAKILGDFIRKLPSLFILMSAHREECISFSDKVISLL